MKRGELQRSEWIAVAGGLIMALGLFLTWYHLKNGNVSIGDTTGPADLSGWQVHTILRWLLLAAAVAPFILTYIILRGHALSWPRGELTAVVGITAAVLILYQGVISKPGTPSGEISLKYGWFLALIGAGLMFFGSAVRASEFERPRKPPGTI